MKKIFIMICVVFVSCGLDRWEVLPTDQDVSDGGEVAESQQESPELSESSAASTEPTSSIESNSTTSTGTYPSTGTALTDNSETETEAAETETFDWARVLITEVVTDPQQDWSDSAEGDGIAFDSIPGTGMISIYDEYIEIFNGTSSVVDISQWTLAMVDGSDEVQGLDDESLVTFFSLEGSVEVLGVGEFAVLGNPAGSLNNSIAVELYNELNEIADEVVVDDANAENLDDEAFTRLPDGTWTMSMATPGEFE